MSEPTQGMAEAQADLSAVERLQAAGVRRGLYPRWYAACLAIWTGAMAGTFVAESGWWFLLLIVGPVLHVLYRRKRGAWVEEVRSRRDLAIVLTVSALICGVVVGGFVLMEQLETVWVPIGTGCVVGLVLFALMEWSYHPVWTGHTEA